MPITLAGKRIARVHVIDDNEASRKAVAETVTDGGVVAVPILGPLPSLAETLSNIRKDGDALVSDHHLKEGHYANFEGAKVVAEAYKVQFPGVLCTAWAHANADEIRRYRRWVPAVIDSGNATDPEVFLQGIAQCIKEFSGEFASSRKPWRVQVRVEDPTQLAAPTPVVFVVIPGWHGQQVLKLLADGLPATVTARMKAGQEFFHAMANKGTEDAGALYLDEWSL